ncbi:MAG: DUF2996 domain-containing protein [Cyanobacteria bacterium P01_H01_bin.15]
MADAQPTKAPAKKKEKPPALEDKPFEEFVEQHFVPAIADTLKEKGVEGLELKFREAPIELRGTASGETCWQINAVWPAGNRRFNLYFPEQDIKGSKGFTCSTLDSEPSILESFMIDERRLNLEIMVAFLLKRLNGQKWFGDN